MATHRIIVLSDGTWESVGDAEVMEITERAYWGLCQGEFKTNGIEEKDIINITKVE